jgi:ribosomal protein S18 acetylase RimI-like enzyme
MELRFRPARIADASALAVLVDIAGEGMPAHMWGGLARPGQSILELGRERARRDEGGFSWRNATIAETGDEVAGCLVGYRLDDPYDLSILAELPQLVRPLVELEAEAPGSWYVNVLATFPEFRGRGIGRELLGIAEEKARETQAPSLSVIVARGNEGAARLYARCGYIEKASRPLIAFPGYKHEGDWVLMVKPLP